MRAVVLLSLFAAGCVTVSHDVPDDQARVGANVVAMHCAVNRTVEDQVRSSQRVGTDAISIQSLTPGQRGWVRVTAATRGFQDNVYFNNRTGEAICGGKGWRESGNTFKAASVPMEDVLHDTEEALLVQRMGKPLD